SSGEDGPQTERGRPGRCTGLAALAWRFGLAIVPSRVRLMLRLTSDNWGGAHVAEIDAHRLAGFQRDRACLSSLLTIANGFRAHAVVIRLARLKHRRIKRTRRGG